MKCPFCGGFAESKGKTVIYKDSRLGNTKYNLICWMCTQCKNPFYTDGYGGG